MKILHISNRDRAKLFLPFQEEFNAENIDYMHLSIEKCKLNTDIIMRKIVDYKPTIIIVHHNREIIYEEFWERAKSITNAFLIWWINDERFPPDPWRLRYLNIIDLYLVASEDSAEILQKQGANAQYFMMGTTDQVLEMGVERNIPLVFTGQHSFEKFPLSRFRSNVINRLKYDLGNDFKLYGRYWDKANGEGASHDIYYRAQIGLSINHYETRGTYSNRMLEIMKRGALCLAHRAPGLKEIFQEDKHVVYWDSYHELITKYNSYKRNPKLRNIIAREGQKYVLENFTWNAKAVQLKVLIDMISPILKN